MGEVEAAAGWVLSPYTGADRAAVLDLWHRCKLVVPQNDAARDIDLAAGQSNSDILIGRLDGTPVATVLVGHDGHRGWLYYVAVDPAHQGHGFGRAMVHAAEAWIEARGIPKAQLMVRETNTKVAAFYEALGYQIIPRLILQKTF